MDTAQSNIPQTDAFAPPPPPPWSLTGDGYILLYRFPRGFASAHSPFGLYKGGFGAVMLVDYHTTPVGPYHELLFIPGQVAYPGTVGYSISQIVVSTMESVIGGQVNWGIPKGQADFNWVSSAAGGDQVAVCMPGENVPFFEFQARPVGLRFPVTSAILPPVVQYRDRKTFITRLQSRGQGQLVRLERLKVDGARFPAVDRFTPLVALKIQGFQMTFPVPKIIADRQ
jgi:hypothetical protein